MLEKIRQLKDVAQALGQEGILQELELLEARQQDKRTALVVPLVGEFSAGKTSLLNALTDAKNLETSTKPTTSTIYELHFGADRAYASILGVDGQETEVSDIASLHNDQLGDIPLIRIYDTSTRVPQDLILIDTPGLSSPDEKHREVLVKFLPQADALFVVIDCNQQITNSLMRFIEEASLAGRKTYLIVTKCDTKHVSEIDDIKSYIASNSKLNTEQIACVSAQTGNLEELYALMEQLRQQKQSVLEASIATHLVRLREILLFNIEELLALPNDVEGLKKSLAELRRRKERTTREIDDAVEQVRMYSESDALEITKTFADTLYSRLDTLLGRSADASLTADANAVVMSTKERMLTEYRIKLTDSLQRCVTKASVPLQTAVARLDLGGLNASVGGFNIDLANVGHEHDKLIGNIAIGVAIAGAVIVTAGAATAAAGAAATTGAATAAGTTAAASGTAVAGGGAVSTLAGVAANAGTVVSVADTATDVGSMVYMKKLMQREGRKAVQTEIVNNMGKYAQVGSEAYTSMSVPERKGMVAKFVGMVTERAYAKPQRRRVIHEAIDGQFVPEFRAQMQHNTSLLLTMLREAIRQETEQVFDELQCQMQGLQGDMEQASQKYQERMNQLKGYKATLASLIINK